MADLYIAAAILFGILISIVMAGRYGGPRC
jgi:hypothetical protein